MGPCASAASSSRCSLEAVRSSGPLGGADRLPSWNWASNHQRLCYSFCALLLLQQRGVDAIRISGSLQKAENWTEAVGKFCYDFVPNSDHPNGTAGYGFFEAVVTAAVPPEGGLEDDLLPNRCEVQMGGKLNLSNCQVDGQLYLALYDDESDHWCDNLEEKSCEEILERANAFSPVHLVHGSFNYTVYIEEHTRPRFWYFVFVACHVQLDSTLWYEIHARNNGWQGEFSVSERGTLMLQAFVGFAFTFLACAIRQMARWAGSEEMRSRPLLRLLLMSCICSAIGGVMRAISAGRYVVDGRGWGLLDVIGFSWVCLAKALLTVLMWLCAKGWALFYSEQELLERWLMIGVLTVIVILSLGCEIYGVYGRNLSNTLYLYESAPGAVILVLNSILFTEALLSLKELHRRLASVELRSYYRMITLSLVFYFMTLPVMCILALAFDPWVRSRYVARAETISRLSACAVLAHCLRPTRLDAMVNARLEDGLDDDDSGQEDETRRNLAYPTRGTRGRENPRGLHAATSSRTSSDTQSSDVSVEAAFRGRRWRRMSSESLFSVGSSRSGGYVPASARDVGLEPPPPPQQSLRTNSSPFFPNEDFPAKDGT